MPIKDLLTQFNWVDALVFTPILLRSIYIGVRQGFVVEFFKTLGILFISYFTLHYYSSLGDFLAGKTSIAPELAQIIFYLAISFFIFIGFMFIRQGLFCIIKVEVVTLLKSWGGAILGFVRGIFLTSIIFIFLLVSNNKYLIDSIKQSYFANKVIHIAPYSYRFMFNNLVSKFSAEEKLNPDLFKMLEEK